LGDYPYIHNIRPKRPVKSKNPSPLRFLNNKKKEEGMRIMEIALFYYCVGCLIMRGELVVKGLKGLAEERLAKPDAMRQAY